MKKWCLESDVAEICASLPDHLVASFAGKTIAITGGRGFLGRYFCEVFDLLNREYLDEPCEIHVYDTMITAGQAGEDERPRENFFFSTADVAAPLFSPVLEPDYILHCAGIASPYYYRKFPLETIAAAVDGGRNVLSWARRAGARVLVFSSSEIYGNPVAEEIPTPETYPGRVPSMGARACYDESKRLAETLVSVYHKLHNLSACVVRPFNVYGPGMQAADYRVLPTIAAKLLDGEAMTVYGEGRQTRTFCYITDAIRGFLLALRYGAPGEAYNIGNPAPEISMLDLMATIADICPWLTVAWQTCPYPESYPADEPMRRCPSIAKARGELEYEPKIDLSTGLGRFFGWAREAYRK